MEETVPNEPYRERPEWGPQAGGTYGSPIPAKAAGILSSEPNSGARPHRWLTLRPHQDFPAAAEVAALLNELGASYVLVGGHAVGCWSASARTTADAEFVVSMRDFSRAREAVRAKFPGLVLEERDAAARFSAPSADGTHEAVGIILSCDALMMSALENAVTVEAGGVPVRVPCPEAQVALKAASARSPGRARADAMQDAADIARICEGRGLREDLLEALSAAIGGVTSGFLPDVVRAAREGGDVVDACKK